MRHEVEPREVLKAFIAKHGSQVQAAFALGISSQYLSDLRLGKRPLPDTMLVKLGLRRAIVKDSV